MITITHHTDGLKSAHSSPNRPVPAGKVAVMLQLQISLRDLWTLSSSITFQFKGRLDTWRTTKELVPFLYIRGTSESLELKVSQPRTWIHTVPLLFWQELCRCHQRAPDLQAIRCRTQHLVLTNTLSCHCAPHVPDSPSLCLLIHYLSYSCNKVVPEREEHWQATVLDNRSACVEG